MEGEPKIYMGKLLSNLIKLLPYDLEHLKIFWGLEEELNDLQKSIDAIADLVEDAEEKQQKMVEARRWLRKLRDSAYEADNLLSELAYETTRLKIQTKQADSMFPNLKAYLKRAAYRLSMAYKLKKMSELLRSIQRDGQCLQLRPMEHDFEHMMSQNRFLTHLILESSVVGRDDDVANIVNLMASSCCRRLTVVPIVGRDGLGKTVLAKLVCQKVMERNLFDVKIWVSVSRNSDEHEVFREMLRSLNGTGIGGLTGRGEILQQLEEELKNNKFLLVLDDIDLDDVRWSWYELESTLLKLGVETGNIVLVTTSSERVASIIETSYEHRHTLDSLSDYECLLILEERAFRNVTPLYPSYSGAIGWDIARKCRGVPLVAKVVGGTMGFYRDEGTWLKIRDSGGLSGVQTDVLSILKVSFDHLPSYLKPCFTFCSIFPRGFSIRKEELVQLWMAEGFVESRDEGNRYFYALLGNSFFEDAEMDDNGEVIQCKMHDLVHDLALFVSKFESSLYRLYAYDLFTTASMGILKDKAEKLRTVILNWAAYNEFSRELKLILFTYHEYSWELKRLRTLYLNGSNFKVFPSSIRRIKYLRYIDFLNSEIEELPESSTMLYNLQVLNLSNSKIKKLSESITNLYNLQSLNLSKSKIEELPKPVTQLHNLQILNLSNSNIKELPESIGELQNLQTLNLSYSDIEVLPESVSNLLNLQILDGSNSNIKKLPESIGKLHNLQTLNVSMSKIIKLPESITNLYNLQTLKFVNCEELIYLPRKKMRNLINLKHIVFSCELYMPFGLGKLHDLETLSFFAVGFDWGGSIRELECLNQLRGNLEITRLEEVEDTNEAKRANLQGKTGLQRVGFEWSYGENDRSSHDRELLEGLRPNANIRRLKIKYYMGEKWPSWMLRMKCPSNIGASRMLDNLVDLSLERCWNCEQLPCLGDLICLQFLRVSHMKRLKCIGTEFYGIDREDNLRPFPALKLLSLSWMENLTEWRSPSDGDRVIFFPCLENLSIQSCAKLTGFPVSDLSALTNLKIKDCEDFRFIFEHQSFPSLTSLSVVGCPKLSYLRNWLSPSSYFKDLSLRRCEWLTFIPEDLGKLSSLTSLEMYCCKRLRCFSEEVICKLTQLKNVRIGAFSKELDDFRYLNRIKDLKRLEKLEIWGSDFFGREMSSLPNQLQHLTALKSLKIIGFTTMKALPEWLTNLQSLQSLSLDYCRHLECQSTATILQCLSNLAHLYADCCPVLEETNLHVFLCLKGAKTKVEFSHVSKVRVRLGY